MRDLPPSVRRMVRAKLKADRPLRAGQSETSAERVRMNKTEYQYAHHLDLLVKGGEVSAWAFEADKLGLARRCTYTPDFRVTFPDGHIEYHEVKGFWRDDARVKIKVAARLHPEHRFVVVRLRGRRWEYETIQP